jgi:membrane-associated protease RseP (regulator of RpoE activity)
MAIKRQVEREGLQKHYKHLALLALWFVGALVAIGLGKIAQPIAAARPATSAHTRPLNNNGPFYYWRGADMQPITGSAGPAAASRSHGGMLVERIEPRSPAARSGLKPGDVVRALDGMPVNTVRSLAMVIADHRCGPTVRLSVWRGRHAGVIELPQSAMLRSETSSGESQDCPAGLPLPNDVRMRF